MIRFDLLPVVKVLLTQMVEQQLNNGRKMAVPVVAMLNS